MIDPSVDLSEGNRESVSPSLLLRLQQGDSDAWAEGNALFRPLVCEWCKRASLQESDADDVTQEVFAILAKKFDQFRRDEEGATFRGWLFAITANTIATHFRRRPKHGQAQGGSDANHTLQNVAEVLPPSSLAEEFEEKRQLVQRAIELVLSKAQPKHRSAFIRVVWHNQAPQLVAQELELPVAQVYLAKSRILERLRKQLEGFLDLDEVLQASPTLPVPAEDSA